MFKTLLSGQYYFIRISGHRKTTQEHTQQDNMATLEI